MPSKPKNIFKEAFDTIVFLGFVALLSVAATKACPDLIGANAWEQRLCEPKAFAEKAVVNKAKIDSKIVLSSREVGN